MQKFAELHYPLEANLGNFTPALVHHTVPRAGLIDRPTSSNHSWIRLDGNYEPHRAWMSVAFR